MDWEIGISTGIAYRHLIRETLPPLAEAGFRVLEISTAPTHLALDDHDAIDAVKGDLVRLGQRAHSLHAPFGHDLNLTSPEPRVREHTLAQLRRSADVLRQLGGALLVLHPGGEDQRWVWDREARLALSVEGLSSIWEACRDRGLTMVVETPLPHLLGGQPDDFAWILERLPREGTGVCLDTSHASLGGHLQHCLDRFGDRIVHVQVSDNHGVTDDHLPPGEGRIHWRDVVLGLERLPYRGVFMLEVAGDGQLGTHAAWALACARTVLGHPTAIRSGGAPD